METMTVEEYRAMLAGKKSSQKPSRSTDYNAMLALQIRATAIPPSAVIREYRFHPVRRWRFDFAIPEMKIAMEVDGGEAMRTVTCASCGESPARMVTKKGSSVIRLGGGHHTPDGFRRNREKLNEATILGWNVLVASGAQVVDGSAIDWLIRLWEIKRNDGDN